MEEIKALKIRQTPKTKTRRHVIVVRVQHNVGVLTRITGLFAG
ncbi:MAG: acetolactate synthase small subunit, partial [Aquificota bacterium]